MERRDFTVGVAAMVLTTSLWAAVYFTPLLLPDAPSAAIAGGRYLVLGLASVALVWRRRRDLHRMPWGKAFQYALTGSVGYFLLLTLAVRVAGPTLTVVVMGAGPVLYSAIGARDADERRRLVGPGVVILSGVGLSELAGATGLHGIGWGPALLGLLLAGGAVVSWTWYGLDNARLLASRDDLTPASWTPVVGLATGVLALPLVAFALASSGDPAVLTAPRTATILVALGLGPALLGTVGWNTASKRLSPSTAGQLIVLEPVFALTYAALWTGHAPTGVALLGQLLLVTGASWGVLVTATGRRIGPTTAARAVARWRLVAATDI